MVGGSLPASGRVMPSKRAVLTPFGSQWMRAASKPTACRSREMRVLIAWMAVDCRSMRRARAAPGPPWGRRHPFSCSHQPENFTTTGLPSNRPMTLATAPMLWAMCTWMAS